MKILSSTWRLAVALALGVVHAGIASLSSRGDAIPVVLIFASIFWWLVFLAIELAYRGIKTVLVNRHRVGNVARGSWRRARSRATEVLSKLEQEGKQ